MVRKLQSKKTKITIKQGGKKATIQVPTQQIIKPELKGIALKSYLWEQAKKFGNKGGLKWQSSMAKMQDYINNRNKYNPLQWQKTGKVSFFKDRITGVQYRIKNWKDASIHNIKPLLDQLPENSTFAMGVTLPDGREQFRTFTKETLLNAVNNDFKVTSQTLGSDNIEQLEYILDLSRDFRIMDVLQKNDVPNHCNRQKNSVKTIGRCRVQDVYTKKNNCGFNVLKALGCVTNIKPKDQKGLSTNEMIDLCEEYNFPVKIIDANGEEIYCHSDFVDEKKIIVVSIEEQHYYQFLAFTHTRKEARAFKLQEKREKKKQEKELTKKTIVLVYYDIESVFNSDNQFMAETYSLSYFPILLTDKMPKITPENINEFVQNTKVLWGDKCCAEMVNELQAQYIPTEFTYKFISFNGSSFDDYFLINQAVDNDESIQSCIFSNKSLIGLTFSYGKCWDLRKFLAQGSLADNCESFGTFPKKVEGFDHRLPQKAFDNGTLDKWIAENKDKIIEYNKFDVLSLYSLSMKFRDQVLDLFRDEKGKIVDSDADVFNHDTIGGQAYKLCKNNWKKQGIDMSRPENERNDKFIRKCLTAGRTQVMSTKDGSSIHLKGKKFQMIDVVSLYPTAMLNPDNYYPCGRQDWVSVRDKSKLGFYNIIVKQREDLPNVLPQRDYDGVKPLNWCCKDEYETYCCSVDLDVLEQYGHEFKVINGIEFSDKISGMDLFACQLRFRDAKIIQDVNKVYREDLYNGALREVCKLYLNSLSGKVIQRNFEKVTQIIKNTNQLNKFMDQCHDNSVTCHTANNKFVVLNGNKSEAYGKQAKPSYLGVYIYAYARKLMYTKIFTKIKCHYTDTDSALIYYDDYLTFRRENPELFAKETINLDGKDFEIKPFGTLDCEMKEFDQSREQFQQNEWALLYNESEENQQQIYEARRKWVGCNEAYLLAPKNYLVFNRSNGYMPKLKCKGVSFKGSYCDLHKETKGIVRCQNCDDGYCKYEDGTPLYQDPVRLFEEMVENLKCKVVCDQLTAKTFTNHHNALIGIQFRQVTKTITIKSITTMV